jgi:hypothetical protein
MDELEQLGAELAADPNIQAALSDHEAACSVEDEDNCVVCQVNRALSSLVFVAHSLANQTCDCETCEERDIDELDIAETIVDDLPSALQLILACNAGIKLLSEISRAATFIIAHNELEDHEHEDDGEN